MSTTKFEIEKMLHEVIRDLPACGTVNRNYSKGIITFDEALKMLAAAYKREREAN